MDNGLVLLVDDEPVVLRVQAAAVRQFGFETLIAETAEEALMVTRKHRPSLVISDVQMPGEGGFDFVDALEKQGLKTMPVIYLTGYDDIEIIRGGLRAGGDDFVIKGGSVERLRKRIAFWMASGFQELPSDLRRRALLAANAVRGDAFRDVENHLVFNQGLVDRVVAEVKSELAPLTADFGVRLVERVCTMGRISKLIIDASEGFGDYVRFPDYFVTVVHTVQPGWARDFWPLLKRFEDWSCDTRFVLAGVEPLQPIQNYEWFMEGLA
ncbi:response regulator [Kordiimonas aestuarii]|uniref:response regulator n=1 Tax=Kordiimonas aestuarii TaxID=1005925 RepID=UPI0021D1CB4E|nr:response regulator [Kordiimonas aestuarii]